MNVVDKLTEWAGVAFLAVFGWAWNLHGRVTTLELHQRYTTNRLDTMDKKLDSLDSKIDTLLRLTRQQ